MGETSAPTSQATGNMAPANEPSTPLLVPATPPSNIRSQLTPRKGTTPSPSSSPLSCPPGSGEDDRHRHNCSHNSDGFSGGSPRRKRARGGIITTSGGSNITHLSVIALALVLLAYSPAFKSFLNNNGSHPSLSCILLSHQIDLPGGAIAGSNRFEPSAEQIQSGKFCVPWTVNLDEWHQHEVEWLPVFAYDQGQCFHRVDDERTRYWRQVHEVQWGDATNCSLVHTHKMISSGWGADFDWLAWAMQSTYDANRPFQVGFRTQDGRNHFWHYAAIKGTGRNATCPSRDMLCYFYPLSRCQAGAVTDLEEDGIPDHDSQPQNLWLKDYLTRPQQWLRKAIYDYLRDEAPRVPTPCIAMHVRRADVVLHDKWSRKYFQIKDYLKKIGTDAMELVRNGNNIVLFTDDANAIEEARALHPNYNWVYLNRTRHRGSSGGWENQVPSQNPRKEVIILLSILELAKKCDAFAYTSSKYANVIRDAMLSTGRSIKLLRVDEGLEIHHSNHSSSEAELAQQLMLKDRLSVAS